jgi:GTP-binding protein HflX
VLVKAWTTKLEGDADDPLAELRALAKAAGAVVVDGLTQRLNRIVPKTYIGTGKAEELAERVNASDANLIIFDNDLSPAQIRELERFVSCKILDRSELILDIFASRARTHEAKLQVELAQLEYTAPRLRGMWTHLERIAGAGGATGAGAVGGIGTRGPGERQIEIDRRIVRNRVAALKRELDEIDRRKIQTIRSRGDCFTVSLVGYTNSGKSTLMNRLTSAERYVADKLFATLDTKTVRWEIDDCPTVLLSDTVGFVRDLPHHLVASFRATLEEALHADLLLHVVDAAGPHAERQVMAVRGVLEELECRETPTLTVLNKIDAADDPADLHVLNKRLGADVEISAMTGQGIDRLVEAVRLAATAHTLSVTLKIPVADGKLMAEVDRSAKVLGRRYVNESAVLDVMIDRRVLNRLTGRNRGITVVTGES